MTTDEEDIQEKISLYIELMEKSVDSCNCTKAMRYIRPISQLSNIDYLIHNKVDNLKAVDINRQAEKKIEELINKFDKKCSCQRKK